MSGATVRGCVAAALFALAFGAGAAFLRWSALPPVENDAVEYLALARNVAAGNGFSTDGATPAVYRPPLFSALLGGWFGLTGSSSVRSAAYFQSLMHALGVVAAFLLFLEINPALGPAAGLAALLAVNPVLVTRVVFVLQEPTLLLFTTLAALASARLLNRPSSPRAALAGAVWGLCALAKIVCWFAPLALLATRWLPRPFGWPWRRREAAVLLACCVIVVAPWTARNAARFHAFIPVNGQGAGMLEWKIEHAAIPGQPPGPAVLETILGQHAEGPARSQALRRYVFEHPRYFLVDQVLQSALHYAALPRDWWILVGGRPPHVRGGEYWLLFGLCYAPLYLALLWRTWRLARGEATAASAFVVLLLWLFGLQYALIWGDPRFNLPTYALLAATMLPPARAGGGAGCGASPRGEHEHLGQAERPQPR